MSRHWRAGASRRRLGDGVALRRRAKRRIDGMQKHSVDELEWMIDSGGPAAAARHRGCSPPRLRTRAKAAVLAHLSLFVDDLGDLGRYLRARPNALRPGRRCDCEAQEAPPSPADDELDAVLATTDCAGARQITSGLKARALADALVAAGVARSLSDGVPWWVIALDLDLRAGAARRLYDPALHPQPTVRGRAQRSMLLPSGETVMADDPDGIVYTDADIRALTRSLDQVLGGELSPRRRDGRRSRRMRRLLGPLIGRRSVRARICERADALRFETNPPDATSMQPLVGPHRIAAALRRHDAEVARRHRNGEH